MIPYRDEKIKNAAAFFALEHRKRTKRPLYQTALYKYIAFFDFCSLRETGRPALELTYRAMEHGPVPLEIYEGKDNVTNCRFAKNELGEQVLPKITPDLDYFSDYEVELLNRLIDFFAQQWVSTSIMSDASHEDILAWKRTERNKLIDLALEFEGNLFMKKDSELTFPEQVYLTHKALS